MSELWETTRPVEYRVLVALFVSRAFRVPLPLLVAGRADELEMWREFRVAACGCAL